MMTYQGLLASQFMPQGGLMGDPPLEGQQAPKQSRSQRLFGALGGLVGGPDDPGLSEAQNAEARNSAMIQSGLATILASGYQPVRPSLAQAMAAGILEGRGEGERQRDRMREMTPDIVAPVFTQLREGVLSGEVGRTQLNEAAVEFILSGQNDAAKAVTDLINALPEDPTDEWRAPIMVTDPDTGQIHLVDPRTQDTLRVFGTAADGSVVPFKDWVPVTASDGGVEYRHPVTGEVLEKIPPGAGDPMQYMVQRAGIESTMGSAYFQETRRPQEVAGAYGRAVASAQQGTIPGDVGLLYNAMRVFNPDIRLSEGQVATLEEAGGIPDRWRNTYNRLVTGQQRLTDATRREVLDAIAMAAASEREALRATMDHYGARARSYGINPRHVVYDPFERLNIPDLGPPTPPRAPQILAPGARPIDPGDPWGFGGLAPR